MTTMRPTGQNLMILCALIGAAIGAEPALAVPVTFDFTTLTASEPPPFTRVFNFGDLELVVSARGQDEGGGSNPTETERVSFVAGKGLGVREATDILSADIDAIDGNRGNEELVFTFNQDVLIQQITFADWNNADFANENFWLLNDGAFGSTAGFIGLFWAGGNGGAGTSEWQGLPDYNFPPFHAGPKSVFKVYASSPAASILVSSLTVDYDAPIPEPTSISLLLTGVALLGIAKIRRKP